MPNLLDVDPSIMERNLLLGELQNDDADISAESLFGVKSKQPDQIPWKPVKPNPGYCLKLMSREGDKVFVNVCHTDAIPEPEDISEEQLLQMIMDDDVPSFRVPISIGDLHIESDKSRNPCSAYDIAVNTNFFKKMDSSEVFNTFFLNVSIQALQEKYSLDLDLKSEKPFLILKNRKAIGNLQIHRIQQREVKKAPGKLIQEISSKPAQTKPLIQEVESDKPTEKLHNKVVKPEQNQSKSSSQINKPTVKSPVKIEEVNKSNHINSVSNSSSKPSTSSSIKKETKLAEDSEKGIKECQLTKERGDGDERLDGTRITDQMEQATSRNLEFGQGESVDVCPGIFCIRQYPDNSAPKILIASVQLNVKSSRDFDLELGDNRVSITVKGGKKPWFDVQLPYNIDVNRVEACFIAESQKLLIKMDVIKS